MRSGFFFCMLWVWRNGGDFELRYIFIGDRYAFSWRISMNYHGLSRLVLSTVFGIDSSQLCTRENSDVLENEILFVQVIVACTYVESRGSRFSDSAGRMDMRIG